MHHKWKTECFALLRHLVLFQLSCSAEKCEVSWEVLHMLREICEPIIQCVPAAMVVSSSIRARLCL